MLLVVGQKNSWSCFGQSAISVFLLNVVAGKTVGLSARISTWGSPFFSVQARTYLLVIYWVFSRLGIVRSHAADVIGSVPPMVSNISAVGPIVFANGGLNTQNVVS